MALSYSIPYNLYERACDFLFSACLSTVLRVCTSLGKSRNHQRLKKGLAGQKVFFTLPWRMLLFILEYQTSL